MKELIISALSNAILQLEKRIPLTKNDTKYVSIEDVCPVNIADFMKENNIPNDAFFAGRPNGYDAFDQICLCYDVKIPTTAKDQLKFKKSQFSTIAFKEVYNLLLSNGFKRVGYNSGRLKEFDDTTVYEMFISQDFDRLVKYYSLPFVISE